MRKWLPGVIVLGIAALVVGFFCLGQMVTWAGSKKLVVKVQVIDTAIPATVSGAEVTIFEGPETPIEGMIAGRKPADFVPNPNLPSTQTLSTDSKGRCQFTYPFFAWGSNSLFGHSGVVTLSRVWLRVSAPDRTTALVPVGSYSIHGRDIHDEMPIYLTVVLNKNLPE